MSVRDFLFYKVKKDRYARLWLPIRLVNHDNGKLLIDRDRLEKQDLENDSIFTNAFGIIDA